MSMVTDLEITEEHVGNEQVCDILLEIEREHRASKADADPSYEPLTSEEIVKNLHTIEISLLNAGVCEDCTKSMVDFYDGEEMGDVHEDCRKAWMGESLIGEVFICSRCDDEVDLSQRASKGGDKWRSWCKRCDQKRRRVSVAEDESWNDRVERHWRDVQRRSMTPILHTELDFPTPVSTELDPPVGQAADWYEDVKRHVLNSGQHVAFQLARLCGEDSEVMVSLRSLADAVGRQDGAGRSRAYAERGLQTLSDRGWIEVEQGRSHVASTYRLTIGDIGGDPVSEALARYDAKPRPEPKGEPLREHREPGRMTPDRSGWTHTDADDWALDQGLPARCDCHGERGALGT